MNTPTEVSPDSFDDAEDVLSGVLAQEAVPAPVERQSLAVWRRVLGSRDLALTLVGVLIFIFFALTTKTFLTPISLTNMVRNVARTGIVAVGMTFVMITGEIDISVGSVFGFLTIVLGVLVARNGLDIWLASVITIVLGVLIGLINGLIRTRLGIPSFIVTLAMLSLYRSLAIIVSNQQPWNGTGVGFFYDITGGNLFGIPWQVVWMVILAVIFGVILSKTRFGYHVYATGGNLEAAGQSGINTDRVKLMCFMLTSGLCGFIALLLFGDLNIAAPTSGTGFELQVIAAVIVGGVALTGGRGTIYGAVIGAVIIGMITSGLVLLGLSQQYGDVATGFLIISIGTLDLLVRRAATRSLGYLDRQPLHIEG
ncbi:MAG: ABC transporter permease [Aggregatilineales bacterium]